MLLPVALWPGFWKKSSWCSQLSSRDSLFLKERAACQIGWVCSPWKMVQAARAASLVAAVGQGCTTSCVVAALPPRAAKVGLRSTTWYCCFVCIHGRFPKCDSSGTALGSGLLGSGPCRAHLVPGKCVGRTQCSSQGGTLRSSCLWQIHPSALHLFRVHWFKWGAWKRSAQPFLWAWASSPDSPHPSSVAEWVKSSTRWLSGGSRAEEMVIWTYCQSLSLDSNRDSHQCEMGGDFPDIFWGFLFPRTTLAGVWGRVECLLGLSPRLVNVVVK